MKPNGENYGSFDKIAFASQLSILRQTILRVGRPAEVHEGHNLDDGQMYIVDTSVATEFYEAEEPGRVLIVHRGLLEEAEVLRDALNHILEVDGVSG